MASYPDHAGVASYPGHAGVASYPGHAGVASYPSHTGVASYPSHAGTAYKTVYGHTFSPLPPTPPSPHTQAQYREVSRVLQMGERLIAAYHFASGAIRGMNAELHSQWEVYSSLCDDRSALLALSITFHDQQEKVRPVHNSFTCDYSLG